MSPASDSWQERSRNAHIHEFTCIAPNPLGCKIARIWLSENRGVFIQNLRVRYLRKFYFKTLLFSEGLPLASFSGGLGFFGPAPGKNDAW
jgi:hypothetical protein